MARHLLPKAVPDRIPSLGYRSWLVGCVTVLLLLLPLAAPAYTDAGKLAGDQDKLEEARDHVGWSVEVGAGVEGYDSPVLVLDEGGFIDIGDGRERFSSPYYEALLGVFGGRTLGAGVTWSAALDLEARRLPNLHALDEDRVDVQAGLRWPLPLAEDGEGHLRLRALVGHLAYDGGALRRTSLGWAVDARIKPNRQESRTAKLEWRRYGHDAENDLLDGDRVALTLGYSRGWTAGWSPLLALRAGLVREENRWDEDDFSFVRGFLRAGLSVTPRPGWEGSLALEARHTRYLAPEPGLDFRRRDRTIVLTAGLEYELEDGGGVGCEVELARVHSNDTLYAGDSRILGCSYWLDF